MVFVNDRKRGARDIGGVATKPVGQALNEASFSGTHRAFQADHGWGIEFPGQFCADGLRFPLAGTEAARAGKTFVELQIGHGEGNVVSAFPR